MSELKPCPFCGKENEAKYVVDYGGRTIFKCQWCGASHQSQDDWNTRPIEDTLRAENARLKDVLKQLEWLSRFVNTCPLCYKRKETGHADDCPIGTALKGAE